MIHEDALKVVEIGPFWKKSGYNGREKITLYLYTKIKLYTTKVLRGLKSFSILERAIKNLFSITGFKLTAFHVKGLEGFLLATRLVSSLKLVHEFQPYGIPLFWQLNSLVGKNSILFKRNIE